MIKYIHITRYFLAGNISKFPLVPQARIRTRRNGHFKTIVYTFINFFGELGCYKGRSKRIFK